MNSKCCISGVCFSDDISVYDKVSEIERFAVRSFCRFHSHHDCGFHAHFVVEIRSVCSIPSFAALIAACPVDLVYVSSFDDCKIDIIEHIRKERVL